MSDPEFLWTVDEYCNTMMKRKAAAVRKDEQFAVHRKRNVFTDEPQAVNFMIQRAERKLADAKQKVKDAERRLAGLRKKYSIKEQAECQT